MAVCRGSIDTLVAAWYRRTYKRSTMKAGNISTGFLSGKAEVVVDAAAVVVPIAFMDAAAVPVAVMAVDVAVAVVAVVAARILCIPRERRENRADESTARSQRNTRYDDDDGDDDGSLSSSSDNAVAGIASRPALLLMASDAASSLPFISTYSTARKDYVNV